MEPMHASQSDGLPIFMTDMDEKMHFKNVVAAFFSYYVRSL